MTGPVATLELQQATIQGAGDAVSHEVCCTDEQEDSGRISMCGLPLNGDDCDTGEPSCIVCVDLIEEWAKNADRYREDPQAPDDAPCRCCPRRFQEGLA